MATRAFAPLAFVATLATCSAEIPESSPGSGTPDTIVDGATVDATALPAAAGADASVRLLTPDGWGPLRIGMSRAEVVAAAGEDANPDAVGGPDPDRCEEFRPSNAPAGILVMVEKGVLTRISVSRTADIQTPEGFSVGDRGSDVVAEYGSQARVDTHQYWEPPAKYITVWRPVSPDADRRGIRYEIDSTGALVHLRAGGASIEYIEGCL